MGSGQLFLVLSICRNNKIPFASWLNLFCNRRSLTWFSVLSLASRWGWWCFTSGWVYSRNLYVAFPILSLILVFLLPPVHSQGGLGRRPLAAGPAWLSLWLFLFVIAWRWLAKWSLSEGREAALILCSVFWQRSVVHLGIVFSSLKVGIKPLIEANPFPYSFPNLGRKLISERMFGCKCSRRRLWSPGLLWLFSSSLKMWNFLIWSWWLKNSEDRKCKVYSDEFKMKEKTFQSYQHKSLNVCTVMLVNYPISNTHCSVYMQYLRWMLYKERR